MEFLRPTMDRHSTSTSSQVRPTTAYFVTLMRELCTSRVAPAGVVLVTVLLPILFVSRGEHSEWNNCFVVAARHMAANETIHGPGAYYAYPPCMAWLAVPLALLPLPVSLFLWSLVNIAAVITSFVCCWRLMNGPQLTKLESPWVAVYWLGLLLSLRWVVSSLEHQQFDTVITALLLAGCWAIAQGRDLRAGVLIGLAASMKCTPLLFVPYLIWRGRFRAALVVPAATVVFNLLPDLCFPKAEGGLYVVDWWRQFLVGLQDSAPGHWHTSIQLNQSLAGFFNRLLGMRQYGLLADLTFVQFDPADKSWIKLLTYSADVLLVLITLGIARRPFAAPAPLLDRRFAYPQSSGPLVHPLWGVEFGALLTLMLLLSPMSGKAHYVALWLPTLLIARHCVERPTRFRIGLVAFLLITGTLTSKGFTGRTLGDLTLTLGLPTLNAFATLAGMWELHAAMRRKPFTAAAQGTRTTVPAPLGRAFQRRVAKFTKSD
ncbi:MAG: hypothetical protein C0483_04990 [Pirellula sp.]|nr:hypothetical protein [Pirellula sp.]